MRPPALLCALVCLGGAVFGIDDPLPGWRDGDSKRAILEFVGEAVRTSGKGFIPPPERIAVFDNDGTLWGEQPVYVQAVFVFDRIRALAPDHPEWKTREPFASVLRDDPRGALAGGEKALLEMVMATHAGMTSAAFERVVVEWLETARHPVTGRRYAEMVYQPMLELLGHLRAHGFKTYIVSGGGVEFLRVWAERVYGIPPEQVIGSSIRTRYEVRDGVPSIVRLPEIEFIDDKAGKPVGIHRHIGRRPVLAFGNSDGDFEMLEWTTSGEGPSLGLILHHDDAEREFAYDRESHVGKLARGLDEAAARGWRVVGMREDWAVVYPAPGGGR